MGSAPIMLGANDFHLLRTYAEGARKTICPLATRDLTVFTTSTGEKLTASHLNKIVTTALGGSASQIRKALASRVSDFCCYFSIFLNIYIYIYILYS